MKFFVIYLMHLALMALGALTDNEIAGAVYTSFAILIWVLGILKD